jgi:hypothetical protein
MFRMINAIEFALGIIFILLKDTDDIKFLFIYLIIFYLSLPANRKLEKNHLMVITRGGYV